MHWTLQILSVQICWNGKKLREAISSCGMWIYGTLFSDITQPSHGSVYSHDWNEWMNNFFSHHTIHNYVRPILTYVTEYKLIYVLVALGLEVGKFLLSYNSEGYSLNGISLSVLQLKLDLPSISKIQLVMTICLTHPFTASLHSSITPRFLGQLSFPLLCL